MTQPVKNVSRFPYGNDCMFQRAICRTFFASGSLTSSPSPSPSPSSSKSSCRWAEVQGPRWYMTHSSILSKQPAQCGLICTWYLYNFMQMQSKGSETPWPVLPPFMFRLLFAQFQPLNQTRALSPLLSKTMQVHASPPLRPQGPATLPHHLPCTVPLPLMAIPELSRLPNSRVCYVRISD